MADTDAAVLAILEKEGKESDKDAEIERIRNAFRLDGYAVLDIQPGLTDSDIKKIYRAKSLLIHPDKTSNPNAPDAFDRLKKAQTQLLDEKERARLDEAIADARFLIMRDMGLNKDSEEVKDPDEEFMKAWRKKTTWVIADNEMRLKKQRDAQMKEEGRQQRKEEEELAERKRKRDYEKKWEDSREGRIDNWRDFQKGAKTGGPKKKQKMKTLG